MRLEAPVPDAVLAAIRDPFAAARATPIDVPVMQPLGLILDLSGEAMRARLFVVQGEGGEERCLRPDFTAAVAMEHARSGQASGRYLYEGKAFRVAPAGSGRAEEFVQLGLEIYGEAADPAADADLVALAWRASTAGGRHDLSLRLGDVALFGAFVDALGLAAPTAQRLKRAFAKPRALKAELDGTAAPRTEPNGMARLLAGLSEREAAAALEDLWKLSGVTPVGGRTAAEIAHRLGEQAQAAAAPPASPAERALLARFLAVAGVPRAALDQIEAIAREGGADLSAPLSAWAARLDRLAEVGEDRMSFSPAFGRAFGYYDGMVFEIVSAALGDDRPVSGGGRYDALPARLGAAGAAGALGCMVRPARAYAGMAA